MIKIRIPEPLYRQALGDLSRKHPFAYERVGFFSMLTTDLGKGRFLVIAVDYHSIPDGQYLRANEGGATIGSEAIKDAMGRAIEEELGQVHVHQHAHSGRPWPSPTDRAEMPPLVQSLGRANPKHASGHLIFSVDQAWAELKLPKLKSLKTVDDITIPGFPLRFLT